MVVLMYDLNIARLLLFLALMSSLFQSSTVFGMNDREYIWLDIEYIWLDIWLDITMTM